MIPIGSELRAVIDAMPADRLTFITSALGEPYLPTSFSNWFRERCREAGLTIGLSAHGLRKAVCRRLAEAGCTEKEIGAITGHKTLRMLQRYTEAADQEHLARAAFKRFGDNPVTHRKNSDHTPPPNLLKLQDSNLAVPSLPGLTLA
jgi:integrase